jgi:hypothetical protein
VAAARLGAQRVLSTPSPTMHSTIVRAAAPSAAIASPASRATAAHEADHARVARHAVLRPRGRSARSRRGAAARPRVHHLADRCPQSSASRSRSARETKITSSGRREIRRARCALERSAAAVDRRHERRLRQAQLARARRTASRGEYAFTRIDRVLAARARPARDRARQIREPGKAQRLVTARRGVRDHVAVR